VGPPVADTAPIAPAQAQAPIPNRAAQIAPPAAAAAGQRRIDVATPTIQVANDTGAATTTTTRETKVFATSSGSGQPASLGSGTSRTRGIGNRFRSAGSNAKPVTKPETR